MTEADIELADGALRKAWSNVSIAKQHAVAQRRQSARRAVPEPDLEARCRVRLLRVDDAGRSAGPASRSLGSAVTRSTTPSGRSRRTPTPVTSCTTRGTSRSTSVRTRWCTRRTPAVTSRSPRCRRSLRFGDARLLGSPMRPSVRHWWIGPSPSRSDGVTRPVRRAMISAQIDTAVSSGVRAPMSMPIGDMSRSS